MLIPISILKRTLDNKFGVNTWKDYEVETIIIELGLPLTDVLYDKISILKVIEHHPSLFFEDFLFMVHATSVLNNTPSDFKIFPHVVSLELAFAITEMSKVLNVNIYHLPEFGPSTTAYIREVLINEGYSEVLPPFDIVGLGALPKGQTKQDTGDKEKAITEYLKAMYNETT